MTEVKGTKRSLLWIHFQALSSDKAKCILCKSVLSYRGGTTSNLKKHLNSRHPTLILEQKNAEPPANETEKSGESSEVEVVALSSTSFQPQKRQTSLSNLNFVRRPCKLPRQQKINNLVLNMVVKDLQPFSFVEDVGFVELLHELEPAYVIPHRTTFSKSLLTEKYNKVAENLQKLLNQAQILSLTTDAWTSISNDSYIGVTAHFINDEWKLFSCLLDCFECKSNHTSQNLSEELIRVAEKWNIRNKIHGATTDNAHNVVNSIKICGWAHVPCFAHTLNLIVQASLKEIDDIRKKVKKIVEHFHKSTQSNNKLISTQSRMNPESVPLKLINDVVTRWNSTFAMFERIIKIQEPLTATMALLHNPIDILTEKDWEILKEVTKMLLPFKQLTDEMSSEKSVTVSKILNIIAGLKTVLESFKTSCTTLSGRKLIDSLLTSLNSRFANIELSSIIAKAAFLDPRFRSKAFSSELNFKRVKDKILEDVISLINADKKKQNEKDKVVPVPVIDQSDGQSDNIEMDIVTDEDIIWQNFDKQNKSSATESPTALALVEIRNYLLDPQIARKQNPLGWWKSRELVYPRLSLLAKKYLCLLATSVPSERIFSKAGQLISERRNRLKGRNVQKILFLNANQNLF